MYFSLEFSIRISFVEMFCVFFSAIGFFKRGRTYYRWSDGSSTTFTNWNLKEPGNNRYRYYGMYCGEILTNGFWNDYSCYTKRSFICKKQKGKKHYSTATTNRRFLAHLALVFTKSIKFISLDPVLA